MIKMGNKHFKSKSSLQAYCKYVLNNSDKHTALTGEWLDVILDVFKGHESFVDKVKGQEFNIKVRSCPVTPKNRQFYIEREDGSTTDFSYMKAISPSNKLSHVKATLRESVSDQVFAFKTDYFNKNQDALGYVICDDTGLKIKMSESHVDHYPLQFDEIVQHWADREGVSSELIKLMCRGDNSQAWEMEDKDLLKSFQTYHRQKAKYRVVLNKVNLQRKKAKRAKF